MGTTLAAHKLRGESIGKVNLNLRVENSKLLHHCCKNTREIKQPNVSVSSVMKIGIMEYFLKRYTDNKR